MSALITKLCGGNTVVLSLAAFASLSCRFPELDFTLVPVLDLHWGGRRGLAVARWTQYKVAGSILALGQVS